MPNDSIKNIKKKSKKNEKIANRRSQVKYPALARKYNLKMRMDYIEPDYINGVRDASGKLVIRALTAKEKKFLNSFYEEVIGANFKHDVELRKLHDEMNVLKSKARKGKDLSEDELIKLDYLQLLYFDRADEVLLYPKEEDQKKLYGENNSRNRCIFNRSRAAGKLDELNNETMDDDIENKFTCPDSGENLIADTHSNRHILRKRKKRN